MRVRAALTCGTDVKVFKRGYHARMIVPPALFGHELAGDVVEAGAKVSNFSVGDRLAANSAPCGKCYYCSRNQENLCEDLLFNNGAYADTFAFPNGSCRKTCTRCRLTGLSGRGAGRNLWPGVLRGLEESNIRPGDAWRFSAWVLSA